MDDYAVDVIVVGAGPVGMTASLKLAQQGWRVQVIERWPERYGLPRAVALDFESMRTFQGIGVADEQFAIGAHGGKYEWQNAAGDVLLLWPSITGISGWGGVNICQPETEDLLEQHLQAEPLVTLTRGVEVIDLDEDADGITAQLRNTVSSEPAGSIRARYVIGADGAHSIVRSHIGTPFVDKGFFFDWFIVDVIPEGETEWGVDGFQICSTERPTTMVAGGPGRRRWEFMLLPGETKEEIDSDENAWRLLADWGITPDNATLERRAVYTFQARWAETWNKGRALVAGDAAHLMPPFAGQGLNSGIRDVTNLTWKLDLVLAGKSPASILDSYTTERSEHVRHAIEMSVELGKVICILDPEQAAARDAAMLPFAGDPNAALPPLPEAAFHGGLVQRDSAGNPVPPGGTPSPQFEVGSQLGTGLFDDVFGQGATLLTTVPRESWAAAAERFEAIGGRVAHLLAPGAPLRDPEDVKDLTGGYHAELERLGAVAALYRPDAYWFGTAASESEIGELLDDWVRQLTAPTQAPAGAAR